MRRDRRGYLPSGSVAVGCGVLVAGVTAYGFLIVSARSVGPADYAPLSVLWALVLIGGPGMFLPVEQEVSRAMAARRASGQGGAPLLRRAATLGGGAVAVLLVATLLGGAFFQDVFDHQTILVVALALAIPGYLGQHLARGFLAADGRFSRYGVVVAVEGVVRLAGGVALALAGTKSAGPFGLVVGLAPLLALAAARPAVAGFREPGPPAPWGELSTALGHLLAGSVLSQVLVNVGPVAVKAMAPEAQQAAAGRFMAALVLTRVPVFLFGAVYVAVLPRLSRLASAGPIDSFRSALGRLLRAVLALAIATAMGGFLVGPAAVRVLFGSDFVLGTAEVAALAAGAGAYMVALTLAQGLIALVRHGDATLGWLAGVVCFAVVSAIGDDVVTRVALGVLFGQLGAAVVMALLLTRRLRALPAVRTGGLHTVYPAQLEP